MKKILVLFLMFFCAHASYAKEAKLSIPANAGYVGSLPDLTTRFQKSETEQSQQLFDAQSEFNDNDSIKPAPRNNAAFINIIMKKDKTSQYVNDINDIIPMIEKIQNYIEAGADVQKFNAATYYLDKNVEFLRNKYKNKAEESYISFKKLAELNMQAQAISKLRSEKEIYSPYMAYTDKGYVFNQNNVDTQLQYLLKNIEDTLLVLKEVH